MAKIKKSDKVKPTPIEIKWTDIKFNGKRYTGFKITVYDYKKNIDRDVFVSTSDLEKELMRFYFDDSVSIPKVIKDKATQLFEQYTIFLPKESFNSNMTPREMKTLVEKNLYPNRY